MKTTLYPNASPIRFDSATRLHIPECAYGEYLTQQLKALINRDFGENGQVCHSITFSLGIPQQVRSGFAATTAENAETTSVSDDFVEGISTKMTPAATTAGDDEEYALILGEETFVYANKPQGFLRALSTLLQYADRNQLRRQTILDAPACAIRGYRVYMPGHETMGNFLEMLDFMVYYKYNTLILEIGGAMEYKRHPRINQKWVEFCQDINSRPGRADEVQMGQQWAKNSIHSENGDGAYLTQEECRFLAVECAKRGIEIIPECPSLSHSDYICLAYPQLAERQNDPYPDTYCPANPDSYKVVFDILDEVIDVFHPHRINIGHDESYNLGICDRCRDKDVAQIYADDVKTIQDYLKTKGVSVMMWGEALVKARYFNGNKIGGWRDVQIYNGVEVHIPWLFRCADLLPQGVTYLHWYWEFGEHLDDEYHARNYPVVFGNFNVLKCENYRTRINRGVKGGFVSNWGSCAPEYMQRNLQYFQLISSGQALWSDSYDSCDAESLKKETLETLYAKFRATVKHPLRVRHAACHSVPQIRFWCGKAIEDDVYLLGHYQLTYTDGTKALLPVKLGTNIACHSATEAEILEAAYSTTAIAVDNGFLFEHLYEDPHPEKVIASICYLPEKGKEDIQVIYTFPDL